VFFALVQLVFAFLFKPLKFDLLEAWFLLESFNKRTLEIMGKTNSATDSDDEAGVWITNPLFLA
jgi:hypothetical protein